MCVISRDAEHAPTGSLEHEFMRSVYANGGQV
jgi:hypothetical protein